MNRSVCRQLSVLGVVLPMLVAFWAVGTLAIPAVAQEDDDAKVQESSAALGEHAADLNEGGAAAAGRGLTSDGRSMCLEWADDDHLILQRDLVRGHDEILQELVVRNVVSGEEICLPRKLSQGVIRNCGNGGYVSVTVNWSGEIALGTGDPEVELREIRLDSQGLLLAGIAGSAAGPRAAIFDLQAGKRWSVALPKDPGLRFQRFAAPFAKASGHNWLAFCMATGQSQNNARRIFVFDLETGKQVWEGRTDSNCCVCPFWTGDDGLLVPPESAGGGAKNGAAWREVDLATGRETALSLEGCVDCVAPKGPWVVIGGHLYNRDSRSVADIVPSGVAHHFSPNGRRVAWTVRHDTEDEDSPEDVYWLDLSGIE